MSENSLNSENEGAGEHGHPKPLYDDVNIPVVVLLGILSSVITFVSICFVQGLFYQWGYTIAQKDWSSRIPTAQEQIITDQRKIRDGFYETREGGVYISVDVSAGKLIAQKGKTNSPPPAKTNELKSGEKTAPKPTEKSKPVPPGPEPNENVSQRETSKNLASQKEPGNTQTKPDVAQPAKVSQVGKRGGAIDEEKRSRKTG